MAQENRDTEADFRESPRKGNPITQERVTGEKEAAPVGEAVHHEGDGRITSAEAEEVGKKSEAKLALERKERLWLRRFGELCPWLLTAITVLSANVAASVIYAAIELRLEGARPEFSFWRLVLILVFFALVVVLFSQRNALFRPRTRYLSHSAAEGRKHLVLFLSYLGKRAQPGGIPDWLEPELKWKLETDLEKMREFKEPPKEKRWPWEMPLIAIRHHLDRQTEHRPFESVTLICSTESMAQAPWFFDICSKYGLFRDVQFFLLGLDHHDKPMYLRVPDSGVSDLKGFDFETFDQLSEAIWFMMQEFRKRGIDDKDVMIDVTGGQKPTSIVGAMMTLNRKLKAQYVQTNKPYVVISYDLIQASWDTGNFTP